uniref:Uncharacterized protein n=1 Tax=Aplanochytrium stocchinoi TaxID=215587 RepID=A0A6S8AVL8_9STRA|mmetsp:Transcript_13553/g.15749  ORF Transcript_13553/g.15749 Transcript_13553/m.15749 type:complete len:393 (-) Transcript_13553:744-1922(-)
MSSSQENTLESETSRDPELLEAIVVVPRAIVAQVEEEEDNCKKTNCLCSSERWEKRFRTCKELGTIFCVFTLFISPLFGGYAVYEWIPRVLEEQISCDSLLPQNGPEYVSQNKTQYNVSRFSTVYSSFTGETILYNADDELLYALTVDSQGGFTYTDSVCIDDIQTPDENVYCVQPKSFDPSENEARFEIYAKKTPLAVIKGTIIFHSTYTLHDRIKIIFEIGEYSYSYVAEERNRPYLKRINYDYGISISATENPDSFLGGEEYVYLPWLGAYSESGEFICSLNSNSSSSLSSVINFENLLPSEIHSILRDLVLKDDIPARVQLLTQALLNTQFEFVPILIIFFVAFILWCCQLKLSSVWDKFRRRNRDRTVNSTDENYLSLRREAEEIIL